MKRKLLAILAPPVAVCRYGCAACCEAPIGVFHQSDPAGHEPGQGVAVFQHLLAGSGIAEGQEIDVAVVLAGDRLDLLVERGFSDEEHIPAHRQALEGINHVLGADAEQPKAHMIALFKRRNQPVMATPGASVTALFIKAVP